MAECGARSLAACQGIRQLSPQMLAVLGGEKAVRETSLFLREPGVCNIQLCDNTFTL